MAAGRAGMSVRESTKLPEIIQFPVLARTDVYAFCLLHSLTKIAASMIDAVFFLDPRRGWDK
jgi:hypothetical protein